MSDGLLFEISPDKDEDSKKKKKSVRRKQDTDPVSRGSVDYSSLGKPGYVASLDVPCPRCGSTITDLAEVYRSQWLLVCGWDCGLQWFVDPIPGVLGSIKTDESHKFRSGRHRGETIEQVWNSSDDGKMYVRGLAKVGQDAVDSRAAKEWLSKNGIDHIR